MVAAVPYVALAMTAASAVGQYQAGKAQAACNTASPSGNACTASATLNEAPLGCRQSSSTVAGLARVSIATGARSNNVGNDRVTSHSWTATAGAAMCSERSPVGELPSKAPGGSAFVNPTHTRPSRSIQA